MAMVLYDKLTDEIGKPRQLYMDKDKNIISVPANMLSDITSSNFWKQIEKTHLLV